MLQTVRNFHEFSLINKNYRVTDENKMKVMERLKYLKVIEPLKDIRLKFVVIERRK